MTEFKGWLTGWKNIAVYLDVHWETARRWAEQHGLPVVKLPSNRIVALPAELDAWMSEFGRLRKEAEAEEKQTQKNKKSPAG